MALQTGQKQLTVNGHTVRVVSNEARFGGIPWNGEITGDSRQVGSELLHF